ncbi:MAG: TIGR00341 family protein [Methyloligellaceae bacterium]
MERLLRITASEKRIKKVKGLIAQEGAELLSVLENDDGRHTATVLVTDADRQALLDKLQNALEGDEGWRIIVQDVVAVIPKAKDNNGKVIDQTASETREELHKKVADGALFGWPTALLVAVSSVVAAVGLIQDSVTVIIGAMVIAPLLGPILAIILGVALGDLNLIARAARSGAFGLAIAIAIGFSFGLAVKFDATSAQYASRTDIGPEGLALALASGAAAALSLTVGVSEALVGVMVAAALLPPAVVIGMMLGAGLLYDAAGAALLFCINVAAITLAGQLVFLLQGVSPRSWYARKTAKQSVAASLVFWVVAIGILFGLNYLRSLAGR